MLMRQLIGRYAGEIKEYPFAVAERCMIAKTMVEPNTPDDPYSEIGQAKAKRKASKKK